MTFESRNLPHHRFAPPLPTLSGKSTDPLTVYILVQNSFGPMSRDVDGLVQAMRALWDGYMFDLDPSVVPMTFDEEVSKHRDKYCW